jgi:ATP synthase protein I
MADKDSPSSLDSLGARLNRARKELEPESAPVVTSQRNLGLAYRVAIEMAAGLAVGAGIGWALDTWFGTKPVLLVVMIFMGFAAGMLNAYRTSRRIAADAEAMDRTGSGRGS